MKIIRTAAQWVFILCLPLLLFSAVIGVLANSLWLYEYGADKYGVGQSLADEGLKLSDAEISGIYAGFIKYYNSGEDYVTITVVRDGKQINVLTSEEVHHFKDVKGLIRLDYRLLMGTLLYSLAFIGLNLFLWRDGRQLGRGLLGGSIFTLVILVVIVLCDSIFGFNNLFMQFHFVFFDNLLWSAQGYMLVLFPEDFFVYAATSGAAIIAGAALIMGGAGWWRLRKEKPAKV